MIRELTCIVCPRGCSLRVEMEGRKVQRISGNSCTRGEQYAYSECTNPVRTVTSTIRTLEGELVPVKTSQAIPKGMMFAIMEKIQECHPAKDEIPTLGSVVCPNILDTGADLVTTADVEGRL